MDIEKEVEAYLAQRDALEPIMSESQKRLRVLESEFVRWLGEEKVKNTDPTEIYVTVATTHLNQLALIRHNIGGINPEGYPLLLRSLMP